MTDICRCLAAPRLPPRLDGVPDRDVPAPPGATDPTRVSLQAEAAFVAFLGQASHRAAVAVRGLLLLGWAAGLSSWAATQHDAGAPNRGGSLIVTCSALAGFAAGLSTPFSCSPTCLDHMPSCTAPPSSKQHSPV